MPTNFSNFPPKEHAWTQNADQGKQTDVAAGCMQGEPSTAGQARRPLGSDVGFLHPPAEHVVGSFVGALCVPVFRLCSASLPHKKTSSTPSLNQKRELKI